MLERRGRARHGRRAWPATVVLVTAATLGAACGDEDGEAAGDGGEADVETVDFEATGAFLASASERSTAEPYRFETSVAMTFAAEGESVDVDAPFSSGAVDGDGFVQHIDMNEYMDQMTSSMGAGGSMPDLDLTIDTVVDGETMWLRAPMFAQIGELGGAGTVPPAFTEMGDGWGRVDISALGPKAVGEATRLGGSPTGGDPREILAMLESADDVSELGEDTVDGDPVEGIGATMSMGELVEAGGADLDAVTEQAAAQAGDELSPEEAEAAAQAMLEAEMPIEAWVDDDGYVRRVVMTIDMAEIATGMGEQVPDGDQFAIGTTVEFTDYGDTGIDVAPPPEAADAVDLTEAFTQLQAAG